MEVVHDEKNMRFRLIDEGGREIGHLEYMQSRRGVIFARKTEVEEEFRGRGLGKPLLEALVSYARQGGYKIRPVCKYVKSMFEKYPEKYCDVAYPDDLPCGED